MHIIAGMFGINVILSSPDSPRDCLLSARSEGASDDEGASDGIGAPLISCVEACFAGLCTFLCAIPEKARNLGRSITSCIHLPHFLQFQWWSSPQGAESEENRPSDE